MHSKSLDAISSDRLPDVTLYMIVLAATNPVLEALALLVQE
jgi:hypothetical protein